jgi:hypothetical protein
MNTSTKILLGLLLAVIVVPILLAMSLKNKQRNNEFKTGTYGFRNETPQKGQFGPYKTIQIVGPEAEALTCFIDKSEQAGYDYMQYESTDSVTVYVQNDTLFVKQIAYVNKDSKNKRTPDHIELRLHLPIIENISIDGANVVVDSAISMDNITLKLKNYGAIKSARLKGGNETSLQAVPAQGKETAENLNEIKSSPIQQPVTVLEKEVKDVVIFHLM